MSPLQLLQGGLEGVIAFALLAAALILAIGLHEYAHALAADLQGDRLPRAMGRLTLNPIKHLDPLGTLLLFVAGFGWGKPVEFRPEALSSRRFGAAIVAVAGPLMNVFLGLVGALLLRLYSLGPEIEALDRFLTFFIVLNVILALFNLLPVPPLDGSRLLTIFLPPSQQKIIFFLDRFGFLILMGLVILGPALGLNTFAFFTPLLEGVLGIIETIVGVEI